MGTRVLDLTIEKVYCRTCKNKVIRSELCMTKDQKNECIYNNNNSNEKKKT